MRIVSMTSVCVDLYDGTEEIFPGGESLNFVMNWSKNPDEEIYLIGAIGLERYGDAVIDKLSNKDVNLQGLHRVEGVTANNFNYVEKSGERREKENAWNGGVYDTFKISKMDEEIIAKADLVHTSINSPVFEDILNLRKTMGFKLAVDFNVCRDIEKMERLAGKVAFMFITASDSVLEMLKKWSQIYDGVYIGTLAERGSVCFKNGICYRQDAIKAPKIVDTTGCGDSYQSGFLSGYMRTYDLQKAMHQGALHACETMKHFGGC